MKNLIKKILAIANTYPDKDYEFNLIAEYFFNDTVSMGLVYRQVYSSCKACMGAGIYDVEFNKTTMEMNDIPCVACNGTGSSEAGYIQYYRYMVNGKPFYLQKMVLEKLPHSSELITKEDIVVKWHSKLAYFYIMWIFSAKKDHNYRYYFFDELFRLLGWTKLRKAILVIQYYNNTFLRY